MKIARVRAEIPRGTDEPRDWRTAMAQIAVTVETDPGLSGLGVGGGGAASLHIVDSVLNDVLVGADPADIEGLWAKMYRATLPFGRKGLAVMALSGVNLALWDLAGKAAGRPVYELLGGLRHPVIPAYASIGWQITDQVERGFRHVKLHMPNATPDPRDTIEIVRVARQKIGPGRQALHRRLSQVGPRADAEAGRDLRRVRCRVDRGAALAGRPRRLRRAGPPLADSDRRRRARVRRPRLPPFSTAKPTPS